VLNISSSPQTAISVTPPSAQCGIPSSWTTVTNVWGNWPSCPGNNCAASASGVTGSYTVASLAPHAVDLRILEP